MIETIELFPELNKNLLTLLKNIDKKNLLNPTVIPGRTVKDLASHILDGSLRRLSIQRDHFHTVAPEINSYNDLVNFIQKLNREWIEVSKRLSPEIIIAFLENSENWLYEFFKSLDLHADAPFSVAWAGEDKSKNWFDIAREYTEKWHHQMQIRLAVYQPGINSRKLFYPVIDTFMLGLPFAYRDIKAPISYGIKIIITGDAHGIWFLEMKENGWQLVAELSEAPKSIIEIPDDIAWKLFTNSMDRDIAAKYVKFNEDSNMGKIILNMRTVMS